MSDTSNTVPAEGTTSTPGFDRDLLFYTSATFVLEPDDKSSTPSADAVKRVALKIDPQSTITKDTRTKNYWLHASTKYRVEKFQTLVQKKASLGGFTIRKVHAGSPEEERVRRHIAKWLASIAIPSNEESSASHDSRDSPTNTTLNRPRQHSSIRQSRQDRSLPVTKLDVDEAGPSNPEDAYAQEDARAEGMNRRSSSRLRAAPRGDTPTPSNPSTLDEPSTPGPSRVAIGKRATTSLAFSRQNKDAVSDSNGPNSPEIQAVERPRKRVRIDLTRNTYKYLEEWNEPGSIPSSSNASSEAQFAPIINELPQACLQQILVYSIPDPTSNSARTYRSALYGLMLVCSKWKNAVESAPSHWSYLSNANPPETIDTWIQRSSGVTVTVKFDGLMEYPSRVESALSRFVDKVTPHRLRWKSVTFSDVPPSVMSLLALKRAFNGPAPALVSAKVTTLSGTTIPFLHSLRFFEGNAQALRYITITGVVPDVSDVPVFANIESLRVIRPMGISPISILRMLAQNNRLRSLELVEVRPSYGRLFQHIETLKLPELVHFKLHLLKEDTVEMAQLFTRLRAPKCRSLDLAIDMDHLNHLKLEFNTLDFGMEAFLVEVGAWMAHWTVLNRAVSVNAWVDNIPGVDSSKSAFRWQYGGVVNGSWGHSADVRLEVGSQQMKEFILKWVEDVKLCAELLEAGVGSGVDLGRLDSIDSLSRLLQSKTHE